MGNAHRKSVLRWTAALCILATAACSPYSNNNDLNPRNSGIMGGTELKPEDSLAKFVALLFNSKTTDICTVSILNNQFALTAAHCVADAEAADLSLVFDTAQHEKSPTRVVVEYRMWDAYLKNRDQEKNAGDIAIVRFAGGVPKGYRGVRFLANRNLLVNDSLVTAVGYGTDNDHLPHGTGTLRTAVLPILDKDFSQSELTLNQRKRVGVCHGDSGGPIFNLIQGQYYLWGVTSRSTNLKNCSDGSIITNALLFSKWIYDTNVQMGRVKMTIPKTK